MELRLAGATLVLDDAALEQLVDQVVDQVADRLGARTATPEWIRGAAAAAEYLGCDPQRIWDLRSQGRLEYRKDGTTLMFRQEWLDAVLERGPR